MLTPLQSAQSTAAVSALQSIVTTIEDRQREEAEKASGRKKDDILQQAHLRPDDATRQANARINEHFFGNGIQDGDTLAKLISRFCDPVAGRVLLDGVDLRDLDEATLRRAVVMVTQENFLFSGSVADNIRFGRPDATMPEIVTAAKALGAHEFISALPDGYHILLIFDRH